MEKLEFSTIINATPEKVWESLWQEDNYRKWTAVFSEGSSVETNWQQGSKIKFLDGKGNGIYAIIEKNQPPTDMVFRHQGEISNGEDKESDWKGAAESYHLRQENGTTILRVELDTTEGFVDYLEKKFPEALEVVKQLSESA